MSLVKIGIKIRACRICLDSENEIRVPFDADSKWIQLFEFCFGLTITNENGPEEFCGRCATKLQDFNQFKKLCLQSETLWKSMSRDVKCCTDKMLLPLNVKNEVENDDYDDYYDGNPFYTFNNDSEHSDNIAQGEDRENNMNAELDKEKVDVECEQNNLNTLNFKVYPESVKCYKFRSKKYLKELEEKFSKYLKSNLVENDKGEMIKVWQCKKCKRPYKYLGISIQQHLTKCYKLKGTVVDDVYVNKKTCPKIFYCGICEFTSEETEIVQKHFREHCINKDLVCKLCDFVGRDAADMTSHRFEHYPLDSTLDYVCATCLKNCKTRLNLQFHYRSVHLNKKGGWCSVCNKTFNCYKPFRNHERLHKEKCYICDLCGKKFVFRNAIEIHIREHNNVRNFVCDECGKSFKRNSALKLHKNTAHRVAEIPCKLCKKVCKNKVSLEYHIKKMHGEKSFICEICSKAYVHNCDLKKHMIWHNTERPYACELCDAKFKGKSNYKSHLRIHTGVKPFKCEVCDKSFNVSSALKRHQSVHTGVRNVKCPYCDRTFYTKPQMVTHCRSRHKREISAEHVLNKTF